MKKILKFLGFAFVALMIIGAIAGNDDNYPKETVQNATQEQAASQTNSTQTTEQKPDYLVGEGMYKIGTDVPAGEYMIIAEGMGYMELTKDSSGSLESILTNDNLGINRYLEVRDGEYLKLQSCKLYQLDKAPKFERQEMYKVGVDLPAGEYKITAEGMGYMEVSTSARGNLDDIVSNENFEGDIYVTVQDGQYLKLNNAFVNK